MLETENRVELGYGSTRLTLGSNYNKTSETAGVKMSARTYLISYARFMAISKAKSLSVSVGDTKFVIPQKKLAGVYALARQMH